MKRDERNLARRIRQFHCFQAMNKPEPYPASAQRSTNKPRPYLTHWEYNEFSEAWARARAVLAGEDAVKDAGTRFLPMLEHQTPEEYAAYKKRASFFNATGRTAEAYLGLIFRRPPFLKVPTARVGKPAGLELIFSRLLADVDLLGTSLNAYAKEVVREVIAVGRCGTLLDYEPKREMRPFLALYQAEQIINWRVERVNGRSIPTMVALREWVSNTPSTLTGYDCFGSQTQEQIRVLKLVDSSLLASLKKPKLTRKNATLQELATLPPSAFSDEDDPPAPLTHPTGEPACVVDYWQPLKSKETHYNQEVEWVKVSSAVPLRYGKPLPQIPFVFHGPLDSQPGVDKPPLSDIMAINLDHYRLDADYKHGMHFTALPTAWVSGFDADAELKIGSSAAWVTETLGANAGYLEFTGQGLTTFERAMERDEKLLAVLGSRLLEGQKKVGEAAQAIELRQSGENSVLSSLAQSVSRSLTHVLRWVYWWQRFDNMPEDIGEDKVLLELNTDFSTKGMDPQEIQAVVAAWQAGAISRDTMTDLFRRGEILPEGRTLEEEEQLIRKSKAPAQEAPSQPPATEAHHDAKE